jgi:hypothetical protein
VKRVLCPFAFLLLVSGVFLAGLVQVPLAEGRPLPAAASAGQNPSTVSPPAETTVTIPGPLRSFLRMAGISQTVTPPETLPILAHTLVLQGYEKGRATEFLILLRRYARQATDLSALAGGGNIRISGCKDAEPLLRTLGYKIQGDCGQARMTLVTADAERAFLTVDSGFPLLDLQDALQRDESFAYPYTATTVPVLFTTEDWTAVGNQRGQVQRDFLESLLYEADLARLYWGMSRIEPETREVMKRDIGLGKLLVYGPLLDLYGSQLCVRQGTVVVPGGPAAEKDWQEMVGASPGDPEKFIPRLLTKDRGWLAAYYDAMARASLSQQKHFAEGQRMRLYYEAFRSPGTSPDAGMRVAFRPAPALLVLVSRMDWDAEGAPYVPGNLQVWSQILQDKVDSKFLRNLNKRSGGTRGADQLAETMFVFSRLESDSSPLQIYLYLSELDHRRAPGSRLGDQTVLLLAKKYIDFSDQYLVFSEFPELSDESITRFLTAAEAINRISDHMLRGNAMGIFQANVGLWQILARQGQIPRARLNSSWSEVIKPFGQFTSQAQLVTAGRTSVEEVFRAGTGNANGSGDELINLLAGTHQATTEGQQMHREIANRIRSVLDDQRLVSIDTLFVLDDGLRNPPQGTTSKDQLAAVAGELREFEMPRPIFTSGERTRWAAGTYNNRHTDIEMRTDLVKVIKSPSASPSQRDAARGQLATFLRDSLVGMNYAYYEPPGSQVLHNNPLFVRSHDFSGETVMGIEHVWQAPRLFGAGSPAGGGAHLIGSLADLPYVLAEAEQNFIAPDHVQALIWQQFVPGLLTNATVPRWWNVSRNELHAITLYQRTGEDLLRASSSDEQLRVKVLIVLSDRMLPEEHSRLEQNMRAGNTTKILQEISPADSFYLTAAFRQQFPDDLNQQSASARELDALSHQDPDNVNWERLSRDFGVIHPVFAQSYAREFISVRPFPALGGSYSRLMGECWDSGNLYWARLADEMGYSPVVLNRLVPELTRRMVERIFASDLEDLPATLRALRETGDEFRQGKISTLAKVSETRN